MRAFALILPLLAAPALAEGEFSAGSEAKPWGTLGEEKALFSGTVVDILCDLTGDCPTDCGAGSRQLGILRDADDTLVLVAKNSQGLFTGGAIELYPYCGQSVEVDGTLVGDPDLTPTKVYQIQRIRPADSEDWVKADQWTKAWDAEHPEEAQIKGRWYRKDPRIIEQLETKGYLGLGLDADATFIADWF